MKILRNLFGLDKLLKKRRALRKRVIILKLERNSLKSSIKMNSYILFDLKQEYLKESKLERYKEAQDLKVLIMDLENKYCKIKRDHEEKISKLKEEKEEIIESLTNLDGFRGIKTLVNNMAKQEQLTNSNNKEDDK